MNTCESFSEFFSDYVENTVHTEQRQFLDTHLAQCPSCHAAVNRLQILRSHMRALPRIKTSPDFDTMLRTRLMLERKRVSFLHAFPDFTRMPRMVSYGLASVLILLLVGVFARNGQSSNAFAPRQEELKISSFTTPASNTTRPSTQVYSLDKIRPSSFSTPSKLEISSEPLVTPDSLAESQASAPGRKIETSTF